MDLVGSHETRNKFKLYIFFLIFIFFVTIIVLVLTFKVKLKIIPTENTMNYYWSWINFDGKLLKNKIVVKPNQFETWLLSRLNWVLWSLILYVVCVCMYVYVCMWYFAKLITVSTYIDVLSWDLDTMILG